jgi:glycyl-tRNA synthetase beta chain
MERFRAIAQWLAQQLKLPVAPVERAAFLCKADLVTGMVGEFPDLQGEMGREYARGVELEEVAQALYEHYLPRFSGDKLPAGQVGAVVGIADRLDTIVGILGIGKGPTGAADPYGLRRACLAIVNIVLGKEYRFSLSAAIDQALEKLETRIANLSQTKEQVLDFFRERLKNLLAENYRKDLVEAVISAGFDDLVEVRKRLEALNAVVGQPDFEPLAIAFKRVVNIVEKQAKEIRVSEINSALLVEDAEHTLYKSYQNARQCIESAIKNQNFTLALNEIAQLKPAVDFFFDKVRVLVDDLPTRENRVALLVSIGKLFGGIADFSKIHAGENANQL